MGSVLLILNIAFGVIVLIGFLRGLKGIKKSGLRFVIFLVAVVLAGILTPLISKGVMNLQITVDGVRTSISDMMINAISESPEIADMMSASPSFAALIQNFPLLIGNLVVFVIMCYVMRFLGWIVYLVLASALLKQNKVVDEKGNQIKPKKYRLLGGLCGILHAVVLVFVTFMPISGALSMVTDLSNNEVTVYAETADEEMTPTQILINDYLPAEVKEILDIYENSAIAKVSGIFGIDDFCFDRVASINVNGTKIALRSEVITFSKVYDNVSFLQDLDLSQLTSIKELDFDKLKSAIGYVFDSDILQSILPELSDYACDQLLLMEDVAASQDYIDIITVAKRELAGDKVAENLKNECFAILDVMKTIVESGLYDEFIKPEVNVQDIAELLSADNYAVLNQIITDLSQSKVIDKSIMIGINFGIAELDAELDEETGTDIPFQKIDITDEDVKISTQDVQKLAQCIVNIINCIGDTDGTAIADDFTVLFDRKFTPIFTNIGTFFDTIKNTKILKDINFYTTLMDAMALTEASDYMDFTKLKSDTIWRDESSNFAKLYEAIIDSGVISYLAPNESGSVDTSFTNIKNIVNALATTRVVEGETITNLKNILKPIFNTKLLDKASGFAFKELDALLNDFADSLVDNTNVGSLNTTNLFTEDEANKVIACFDNLVKYINSLDFTKLQEDSFMEIMGSDLSLLGSAMDSLKATELFGDKVVGTERTDGVYTKFIKCLQETEYNDYIGFSEIVKPEFSWNTELASTRTMITALLEKEITSGTETFSLIEYIMKGSSDWNLIFEQITSEDLNSIFTPLLNSKIFRPTALMVINELNNQIKNVVGETLGSEISEIVNIDDITPEEVEQIVEVISEVKDVISDFTAEDFSISDFAQDEETQDKLVNILDALQDNAANEGVFEEAYDSMLEYIKADETIGADVTNLINSNTDIDTGLIDWASVFAGLVTE